MAKIKLDWGSIKRSLDTDTLKLIHVPAEGKMPYGHPKLDASIHFIDGAEFGIANIKLGDAESSNILCEEIVNRFNRYKAWHRAKDKLPEVDTPVLVATRNGKYSVSSVYIPTDCHGKVLGEKRWRGSSSFADSITHWKEIEPVELKEDK